MIKIFKDGRGLENLEYAVIVLIIITIAGLAIYFGTGESQAEFKVKELKLNESKIPKGNTVQANVEVTNTGNGKGSFEVEIFLNGKSYDSKTVQLKAGESKVVEFPVEIQELGEHKVSVGDLSKSFETVSPAEFEISNLKIEPQKVKPGNPVTASVNIKNTGGMKGSHEVKLYVGGTVENSKSITLAGGENAKVSLEVRKKESKAYNVKVGGLTGSFEVSQPKIFKVEELSVKPTQIGPNDTVTVSAFVKNATGEKKERTLDLKINNKVEKSVELSLKGGNAETLSFSVRKKERKEYTVSMGDKSEKFSVVPVVNRRRLYNDSFTSPKDGFTLIWSGADWGGPPAKFDNQFKGITTPEGKKCFKVEVGAGYGDDDSNYAGFGFYYGKGSEGNVKEKSTIKLSAYEYLEFWIKTPKTVTVELETLDGTKPEVKLTNQGWNKEKSSEWQKITIPKEEFGLGNYTEIYGAFLITLVAPETDFYVDNVTWVDLSGGNMPPSASFDLSPSSPSASDTIQFTSESSDPEGNIESYSWRFGDGTTSSGENPTHKYSENGIYSVKLKVTDGNGLSDTYTKRIVVGNQDPNAKFTYSPKTPDVGEEIQFIDNSSDYENNLVSYSWSFGDGKSSEKETPTHKFSENGIYSVKLTVTDNYGAKDTYVWDIPVGVHLENESWQVTWLEKFEENSINRSAWSFDVGGWGWGNNELEYHTDRRKNARTENGNLIIEAHKEEYKNRNYTSARLKTQSQRSWTHGKIEARIKLPYGQGIWPAFWMLGESFTDVGWPACGEIDIMEMIGGGEGRDDTIHGTIHYQPADSNYNSIGDKTSLDSGIFADSYHVFGIEWTQQEIKWYLDGEQYFSTPISSEEMSEFHKDFFIILNIAVGGNWPGSPNENTEFPQQMYVDWVKVSKKQ